MTFEEWWESDLWRHGFGNKLLLEEAWQAATKAERERCAKMAEEWPGVMQYEEGKYCADIDVLAEGIREGE